VCSDRVATEDLLPLFDPQTSGGLLIAVPRARSEEFVLALEKHTTPAAVVGEVIDGSGITVTR
jgi:selenide,water dikinase